MVPLARESAYDRRMDVTKLTRELQAALKDLQRQRDALDSQIRGVQNALSSLRGGGGGGKAAAKPGARTRKKPHWSPEARKAAADRMKKYWASQKKKAPDKKKTASARAKAE